MTFWEGFFTLNSTFIMIYLSVSLFGVLLILWELANRKLKIDKSGVSFDRLRERKPFRIKMWEARAKHRRKEDKISPIDAVNKGV